MPKRKSAAKPKAPAVEMPAIPVVELGPAAKPTVDAHKPPPPAGGASKPTAHYIERVAPGLKFQPMDFDGEAERSGPPPVAADVTPAPAPAPASSDDLTDQQIEAKLKDPTFDPSGVERLRLAKLLQRR